MGLVGVRLVEFGNWEILATFQVMILIPDHVEAFLRRGMGVSVVRTLDHRTNLYQLIATSTCLYLPLIQEHCCIADR
jgi:hypothetical protein